MIANAVAQSIVDDVVTRLGINVNIMDDRGVIIASSDRARVGSVHEGALLVLRTGTPLSLSEAEAERLGGTRAGVNVPMRVDGKVVSHVARLAAARGAPVVALAGQVVPPLTGPHELGLSAAFSIADGPGSLESMTHCAAALLADAAEHTVRLRLA